MTDYDAALAALAQQEGTITSARAGAIADRDRLSLQLVSNPDNKSLAADLAAVEEELVSYSRDLERIAAARRALAVQKAADNRDTRTARLIAARKRAVESTANRVKASKQIEKAVAALGEALEAEGAAGNEAWSAVLEAAQLASGTADTASVAALAGTLHCQAVGSGCVGGVLSLLNAALRRGADAGSKVADCVVVQGFTDPAVQPAVAAQAELDRLTATLNTWEAA